jgi:hypothetical protein
VNQVSPPPIMESALATQVGGSHYKEMAIQPLEFIHANSIPFAEGSIIKYVSRWRVKNGIADLEKARHFLDLLIELEHQKIAAAKPRDRRPEGFNGCGNVGMEASDD